MRLMDIYYRHSKLLRGLGFAQYCRYQFAPQGRLLQLEVLGHQIYARKGAPDWEVAHSCFNGEFESLRYLFPKDYAGVIIDAGGFIGTAAIALSEMFPEAKVITIEPSSDNLAVLTKNIAAYPNIEARHGALVADSAETIALKNRQTGEVGFSVVDAPQDCPEAEVIQEVPAYRLSSLGVPLDQVGILKLDIEGGEFEILTKERANLEQIPAWFVELHDRIVPGCSKAFFELAGDRIVIQDSFEKYLAVSKKI